MRVALVGSYWTNNSDGVTQAVVALAKHLPTQGVEVEIWQFEANANEPTEEWIDQIQVLHLPCHRSPALSLLRLPGRTLAFLEKRVRHVDLIHLHSVFRRENLCVSALGVPFIVTPHNGYHERVLKGRNSAAKWLWARLWEQNYLNRARLIHAVSAGEVATLRAFGVKTPIVCIPNVLDRAPVAMQSASSHPAFWGYLGRLDVKVKGLDLLIHAYGRVYRKNRGRLPGLHLVGPDCRSGQRTLRQLTRKLGLEKAVQFTGPKFISAKWQFLSQCQVFVHPSRFEGLPFAVLEAMAVGRPVLITQATNLGALVREYGAGWVVPCSSASIAEAMQEIIHQTPATLNAMGRAAQALVREHFDPTVTVKRIAEMYHSVRL